MFSHDGRHLPTKRPLFLWDACQACASLPRVDLSVSAYAQLTGDKDCWQGNVPGFEVRVMDNFIHRSGARRTSAGAHALGAGLAVALVCLLT